MGWGDILAHAQHPVDLGDTQPVQDVRHQRLEAHIFDTGDVLGPLEVVGGPVFATLAGVVHDCGVDGLVERLGQDQGCWTGLGLRQGVSNEW